MDFQCRLCAGEFSHRNPTILFDIKNHELLANIEDIIGLSLDDEEHLPRHICDNCLQKLTVASDFRDQCRQVQQNQFGRTRVIEPENPDLSYSEEEFISEDSKVSDECEQMDIGGIVFDTECDSSGFRDQNQELSDFGGELIAQESEGSAEWKCDTDGISSDTESEPRKLPQEETSLEAAENISPNLNSKFSEGKFHQIGKVISLPKPAPAAVREVKVYKVHPDPKEAENTPPAKKKKSFVICDQCGELLGNRTNLKMHQLRHSGAKDFACDSCDRRFLSSYLLKVHHQVSHLGERPFACRFCERTFFTSASRSQHQRMTHIRDRSFKCDQCVCMFNTKTDLNKHKFLHTGQKPFRCDLCNLDFSRKINLHLHYATRGHLRKASLVDSPQAAIGDGDD